MDGIKLIEIEGVGEYTNFYRVADRCAAEDLHGDLFISWKDPDTILELKDKLEGVHKINVVGYKDTNKEEIIFEAREAYMVEGFMVKFVNSVDHEIRGLIRAHADVNWNV